MTYSPSEPQQRWLAYGPKPFCLLSAISSSFVIYHIARQKPQKLKRMYHRLFLAMTVYTLILSIILFLGSWALPVGTPYSPGAAGSVQTCTVQGFFHVVLLVAIPFYYASLSLFSFIAVKNNFNEEKYRWIEKFVHPCAVGFPVLYMIWPTMTGSINPLGGNCWIAGSPRGCAFETEINCERGNEDLLNNYAPILGYTLLFLYFVIPPSSMMCLYCWIRKAEKDFVSSLGMKRLIESHRKKMLRSVLVQMGLYLFSFWFTYIFSTIGVAYLTFTGEYLYNILIIGACVMASQGMILSALYFLLDKIAKRSSIDEATFVSQISTASMASQCQNRVTILSIRKKIEEEDTRVSNAGCNPDSIIEKAEVNRMSLSFSIFDGSPSAGSPWAQFIDQDSDEDEVGSPNMMFNLEVRLDHQDSVSV